MNSRIAAMGLCVLAVVAGGCTTAIKEGVGAAMGAKGSVTPLMAAAPTAGEFPLRGYERFELGAFTDDMGGKVPAELFTLLPEAFEKAMADKKIPNLPSGKTLLIRGEVLHYEDSSTVGLALGPLEFVVARVEFVDEDSGRVLDVCNCVGRTTARVNVGVGKKAEGLGRALVKWIDERYPKDERVKD